MTLPSYICSSHLPLKFQIHISACILDISISHSTCPILRSSAHVIIPHALQSCPLPVPASLWGSTILPECRSDHVLSLLWPISGSHCSQVSPDPLAWVTRPFRNWLLLAFPVLGLTTLSLEISRTTLVNPLQLPKMIMLLTFVQNCALCLEFSTAFPLVKWSAFLMHWGQAQVSSVSWSGCSSYVFWSTRLMPLIALLTLL